MLTSILILMLTVAGAGLVAAILVHANTAASESTQLTPAGRQLRDGDPLIDTKFADVSLSMCRLLEKVEAMKAERGPAVLLEKHLIRSPVRQARSGDLKEWRLAP
jgi:hypothetical protein